MRYTKCAIKCANQMPNQAKRFRIIYSGETGSESYHWPFGGSEKLKCEKLRDWSAL